MKKIYLFSLLLPLAIALQAASLLDREITLHVKNQTLESILDSISRQSGLNFSYSSSAVDLSQTASISVTGKPADEVLRQLLGGRYEYKLTRKYIILKKSQVKIEPLQVAKNQGDTAYNYITNQVYVKKHCYSDSGTALGDCPISTNAKNDEAMKKQLAILMMATAATASAQAQAQDPTPTVKERVENIGKSFATLMVEVSETTVQAVKIAADGVSNQVAQLTVGESGEKESDLAQSALKVEPEKQEEVATFVTKTDSVRPFLFTIIYPFSFPELHSERYIYNFSLNLFAGYNGGVEGCELGYIANVNRYSMSGFQGVGVANVSLGSVAGVQAAGVVNVAGNSNNSVQLAGVNLSAKGNSVAQLAYVMNAANTANVQLAGVTNTALQADVQISGVANASLGKNATQIAGVANVADTSNFQVGLVNVARKSGTQIGLINVCDTSSGVMIGLVNVTRKNSLRELEVSGELSSVSAAFRIGTKKFYTFYEVSYGFENKLWKRGGGLGTQVEFSPKWGMNLEALFQDVTVDFIIGNSFNSLSQLRVVGYRKFAKHFKVFTGPTLYVYNSDLKGKNPLDIKPPYTLYADKSGRVSTEIWLGATVGIRF